MKRRNQYVKWGLTAFCTVCAVMVFYDTFYMGATLQRFVNKLFSVLAPVLYGCAIAYLLTPIMSWLEKTIRALWRRATKKELKPRSGALRLVSILLTEAAVIFLLYLLMSVLIPQVADSVTTLINNAESYYRKVYRWAQELLNSNNEIAVWLAGQITERYSDGMDFLTNQVLPWAQKAIGPLTNGIWSGIRGAVGFAFDLIVGIIVSIYVLASQAAFAGQAKKIIYAMFKPVRANVIVETVRKSNEIFGGFISGKLLDSAIIGILAYVVLTIMRMPDTILLAVIIGVTNIIPFFGPFIGAIPSFLIVVLQDPLQGVYFLIFIFILQQIDGNIIGPKILGDSTGLSSFWVVFAILVFGGLWGFPGMLRGVPLMAVIYYVAQKLVSYFLRKRGLVDDTGSYIHLMRIDKRTNELVYEEKTEKGTGEKIEESPEK